jgi:DNA uptake protein ComE-like DNA-binding protein
MIRFTVPFRVLLVPALLLTACADAGEDDAVVVETPEAAAPTTEAASAADTAFLDPNQATREQLLAIPGVDQGLAEEIVAGRPYADMLAVDAVLAPRLEDARRDSVYTLLWMPIDLNTASGDEILLIPGVGERMRHEFEEYRPYRAIEEFRREIGKYVDDAEVARLERYVEVR